MGLDKGFLRRLGDQQLVTPYLENAIISNNWPDHYSVEIDSRPYYGFTDLDGEGGKGGSGDGYFHPSTHPLMGERQLYYAFHPVHSKKAVYPGRSLQGEMTLAMGSALHGIVQAMFVQSGILREENVEVEYVDEVNNTRGRIDFIVDHPTHGRLPVELKTMNSFSFANLTEIKESWDIQLSMGLDNVDCDYGVLLVLESGWPYTMKEFRVPRNDEKLSQVYEKFENVREALETDTPPRHCCSLGSPQMKSCPFRFSCWLGEE